MEERAINCIRREIRGGDCECGYGQQDRGRASVCTCMGLILTIIKEKTMYCIVECRYKREIERATERETERKDREGDSEVR